VPWDTPRGCRSSYTQHSAFSEAYMINPLRSDSRQTFGPTSRAYGRPQRNNATTVTGGSTRSTTAIKPLRDGFQPMRRRRLHSEQRMCSCRRC